ncbi:DUF6339 family protein [Demequina pelophila]|uniref:DUF6339 family protein n=1 Tax=Demequina pelophila TaxID=1638984 RepID=UPI0007816A4E|nr:DUF6339 family protein [Demequina pelophila]
MAHLYPRLLNAPAKELFAKYSTEQPQSLAARVTTHHESAVYVATGGDRVSESALRDLRDKVVELAESAGYPEPPTDAVAFDRALASTLHAEMQLVPAEAASRDMWAFLALCLLPDIAFWRFPTPPVDRVLGTDLTRHVYGRLWWRAQLVHDSRSAEPYGALAILGEAAFDQIYARRTALGGSPTLVRTILEVWRQLQASGALTGLNEREVLRDFLKRLLRLSSFLSFDAISEQALGAELHAVAVESATAVRSAR